MAVKDWKVVQFLSNALFEQVQVQDERPIVEFTATRAPERLTEANAAATKALGIIKKIGYAFGGTTGSRPSYEGPTGFDFANIEKAYLTDSYIRTAIDKQVDFMFKSGYDIVGKNPAAVQYIKQRLTAIEIATQKPMGEFLLDIAEELLKYHNVFIYKARAAGGYSYPQGITVKPLLSNKTVAGYYLLPISTMTIARDVTGAVKKYKQTPTNGAKFIEINPEDIIHVTTDKQVGRAYGSPYLWQVLDDVKMLRQLEELADRVAYKTAFPLMVYKVGLEREGFQATDEEIELVRTLLGELTMDGGIVLPERHSITAVDMKTMDLTPLLKYMKNRVFTGLGVSPTLMGEGDTSNKSTSDNLDQMFKDRIKAYQRVTALYINSYIIYELLLEGGFDIMADEKNKVEFIFREIDLQAKMAEQNHITQLFTQNMITHEQARTLLGYDPVTPEEEGRLYFNMITIPTAVQASQAIADAGVTAANNAGANKNQPTNQHGTKPAAKTKNSLEALQQDKVQNTSRLLLQQYESLRADVIRSIRIHLGKGKPLSKFDGKEIELTLHLASESMASNANKYVGSSFIQGANDAKVQGNKPLGQLNFTHNINLMKGECKKILDSLVTDLGTQVVKSVRKSSEDNWISNVSGAFGAFQYRLRFMATTQNYNAYNTGFAKAARVMGYSEAYVEGGEVGCEICADNQGKALSLLSDTLPPFHPNCTCRLSLTKKEGG